MSWKSYREINWNEWTPNDEATLAFIVRESRVLLIRKKRGLGAGFITGPGGKIDPGETPKACILREVREELHIQMEEPVEMGQISFQFLEGYALRVHLFLAARYSGVPKETEEAAPLWFEISKIPYEEMWPDDIHWLPKVLNRNSVQAFFLFDKTILVDGNVISEALATSKK